MLLHILLWLHIMLFVFSFAFTAGLGIFQARVSASRDARRIHEVFSAARPLSVAGGMGWIATTLVGLALAQQAGVPFSERWMVYSYVAFAVLILTGFLVHAPYQAKMIALSANGPSDALNKLAGSPAGPVGGIVSLLCVLALVYLMTSRMG